MATNGPKRNLLGVLLPAVLLGFFAATPAHAYIDPSSGTLIAQALIGSALGAYTIGKLYLKSIVASIKAFFKRRRPR